MIGSFLRVVWNWFLIFIVFSASFFCGMVAFLYHLEVERDAHALIIISGDKRQIVHDEHMWKMLKDMDKKAAEYRRNAPSAQQRKEAFLKTWKEIKSHIICRCPQMVAVFSVSGRKDCNLPRYPERILSSISAVKMEKRGS